AFTSLILETACGGGGVSSGGTTSPPPPPPPPPPPVNSAPVVSIAAPDGTSGQENGATLRLDASGSSDANGDTLTFTWSQTAGIAATLSSTSMAETTVTLPEVFGGDEILTFEVGVSDGTATTTATIDLTVENVMAGAQFSRFDSLFESYTGLQAPRDATPFVRLLNGSTGVGSLFGLEELNSNLSIFIFERDAGQTPISPKANVNIPVSANNSTAIAVSSELRAGGFDEIAIAYEQLGRVELFLQNQIAPEFDTLEQLAATKPCDVEIMNIGDQTFIFEDVLVGTREDGLQWFAQRDGGSGTGGGATTFTGPFQIEASGSFCHIGKLEPFFTGSAGTTGIAAYDTDTNTVYIYEPNTQTNNLGPFTPISVSLPAGTTFVDAAFGGGPENALVAIAVSNGDPTMAQRLLLVSVRDRVTVYQAQLGWTGGLPLSAAISPHVNQGIAANDFSPEIFVVLEDQSDILVFETPGALNQGNDAVLSNSFSGPQFIDVGEGATDITVTRDELLVTYTNNGRVRIFRDR
ncbi:MAG: hypothetical protein AAGH90_05835, partial [Pseudomonadota bacterium]